MKIFSIQNKIFCCFFICSLFINLNYVLADDVCKDVRNLIEIAKKVTDFSIDNINRFKIGNSEIPDNDKTDFNKKIEKCWMKDGCDGKPCAYKIGETFAQILINVEKNNFKLRKLIKYMRKILDKFENSNFKTTYKIVYEAFTKELANKHSSLTRLNSIVQKEDLNIKGKYWGSRHIHFNQVSEHCNNLLTVIEELSDGKINDSKSDIPDNRNSGKKDLSNEIDNINRNIKELWNQINRLQSQINSLKSR